jgi:hypothetical protein
MKQPISFCKYQGGFWIRFGMYGVGFSIARTPMLFSERMGHKKYIRLPFGWRLSYMPRVKGSLKDILSFEESLKGRAWEYEDTTTFSSGISWDNDNADPIGDMDRLRDEILKGG